MALDFLKNKKPQIGLDISPNGITAVSMQRKSNKMILRNIGYESFDKELIQNGIITNPEIFTNTLIRLLENNGFTERTVNVSVPSTITFIKTITLPDLPINELKLIAPQEASKHIPFSLDEVNIDFQILENTRRQDNSGKKVDIVLVAVSKAIVEGYLENIYNAELNIAAIDVAPFAMIRTITNAGLINDPNSLYISVLIGHENTDINVICEGMPLFTNNAPIGKKNVIDSLVNSLGVDPETLEKMLPELALVIPGMNIDDLDPQKSKAAATVRTVYNNISSEIQKTIEFFHSQNAQTKEIKKIIIGGTGVCLQNIDKYIANRLKIDTILCDSLGNIVHTIDYSDNLIYPTNIPALATSVGLALKGLVD